MTLKELQDRETAARAAMVRAEDAAKAQRVPESDLTGGGEPVTMEGWYQVETRSGRYAAVKAHWSGGRLFTGPASYDTSLEKAAAEAGYVHYEALRDVESQIQHEKDLRDHGRD